jgi:hypothetical protein
MLSKCCQNVCQRRAHQRRVRPLRAHVENVVKMLSKCCQSVCQRRAHQRRVRPLRAHVAARRSTLGQETVLSRSRDLATHAGTGAACDTQLVVRCSELAAWRGAAGGAVERASPPRVLVQIVSRKHKQRRGCVSKLRRGLRPLPGRELRLLPASVPPGRWQGSGN